MFKIKPFILRKVKWYVGDKHIFNQKLQIFWLRICEVRWGKD